MAFSAIGAFFMARSTLREFRHAGEGPLAPKKDVVWRKRGVFRKTA